jgi:hypothetical protein
MRLFALTFALLALYAYVGQAAPLDTKNVAADAKWVAHVDVDAVRDSKIVQKAFAACPELKESGKHFDELRDKIGIDLRKDLHGLTLYGPDADKTHAVAIVYSTVNQKLLLEKAEKAADHKVTRHGSIDIHSWTQQRAGKTEPAAGAFFKSNVLVFAASPERVAAAIDVLDGKSRGLTDANSPLAGRAPTGSTVVFRTVVFRPETPFAAAKLAESFRVATGENNGNSFYHATLVLKSSEAATQIKAIADGIKALGSLRFAADADVMKLIAGLKTTVDGNTVKTSWDASTDDVWTVVEKVAKKAAEHLKKADQAGKGGEAFN